MKKLEISAFIKYFCKKEMPPNEIHEDFMDTLGKESPSYSTVKKNGQQNGGESVEDGRSGRPKDTIADENAKVVHTLVMCDRRRDLRIIASEVGIRFREVQLILIDSLGMSKV